MTIAKNVRLATLSACRAHGPKVDMVAAVASPVNGCLLDRQQQKLGLL